MVTIEQLLRKGTEKLVRANITTARLDAEILLYSLLNVERTYLYMHREKSFTRNTKILDSDRKKGKTCLYNTLLISRSLWD